MYRQLVQQQLHTLLVEDDDVPAIQRQQHETGAAANPAAASVI